MKKTLFSLLAVLMVLSLVVTACGPTPEPTKAPEPTKEQAAPEPDQGTGRAPEPTTEQVAPTEEVPMLAGTVSLWHAWKEEEIEA